jgi:membrane protease YdiL (CAAX protease family)
MLAALGFVVGQVIAVVLVEVAASLAGDSHNLSAIGQEAVPPEWYVLSSLFGLWVGFFGAPWLASRFRGTGRLVVDLGLRFRWIDALGILIGIGGQVLVAVLYAPFISHLHNFSAPTQKLTGSSHGGGFLLIALFTVIGAPFMEELFFRGLLLRGLLRLFSPDDLGRRQARLLALGGAVVLDGLLFALAHAEWEQFAGLALFGVVLALISYRTGRLGMNMVAHASFNAVAVVAVLGSRGVIH